MMRRFWLGLGLLLLGVIVGSWAAFSSYHPYKLNYRRAVINLPITFTRYLQDDTYALGEKYLAEDLAAELKKNGIEAKLYTFEDSLSNRNFNEGFEIFMRSGPELTLDGYHNYADKDRVAVLFETIPYEMNVIKNADIVLTGSLKKNKFYREQGINSFYLSQFTRTDKFYPAFREKLHRPVLFVANQWPDFPVRKSVQYAKETGIAIDVFGDNWENILVDDAASWWKARQIPNDKLKYFYSSADIVLNDTRPDMIEAGFISNRIFDATACGALVISDYMPEIEEIYGDAVPMYKNKEEFKQLIEFYLSHPEERRLKALKAQEITLQKFAADKVIKRMSEILQQYVSEKGWN